MKNIGEENAEILWNWLSTTFPRLNEDDVYKYLIKAVNEIQIVNGTNLDVDGKAGFVFNFPFHDVLLLEKVVNKIKEVKADWENI